jgi:glycosyltransferase involved in cell wall biosynthesis
MDSQRLQQPVGYDRRERVAYILRSYPRLSQTFILHEILALERLGADLVVFAITDPKEELVQPEVACVRAPVRYLERATRRRRRVILREHLSLLLRSPRRYLAALGYAVRHKEADQGYSAASRFECFMQAVYMTRLLRSEERRSGQRISHLHAHFAHDPTLIALLVHMLTGTPYSFTAHARDLYQIPRRALVERMGRATAVVTCCSANVAYIEQAAPRPLRANTHLVHHGVNLEGFRPAAHSDRPDDACVPLIISAGRLVEKKGFPELIEACATLRQAGYRFRLDIYGEGPMREELSALVARHSLQDEVALPGPVPQQELALLMQHADVFALTPYITEDGDRDGLPNVLVEAMACGVPVVSTAISGVLDLVTDGTNGLLAPPRDVPAIARALATLLDDPVARESMGRAARRTAVERFDVNSAARRLLDLFNESIEKRQCLPT